MRSRILLSVVAILIVALSCKKAEEKHKALRERSAETLAESLNAAVNSPFDDFAPIISADGNLLYFTSNREGGKGGQDVWYSHRAGGQWTPAQNLTELNTPSDEGLDTFRQNGKSFYFTADRPGGFGNNDIYMCRRSTKGWSQPENLGPEINSSANDANASLSADGKKLFFVSDRPGSMGGYDIWESDLGADGKWSQPKNIGEPINTDGWEGNVFIAPDGMSLYFSSNGHGGFGGADVFRSVLRGGKWSEPENMGDRINTSGNDTYFTIPGSGDLAYMSSSRPGGKGGEDIYAVPMPMLFAPKKIVVVTGNVLNKRTGAPMQAYVKVKYRPTRRDIASTVTRADGKFRVAFVPTDELMLMIYTDDKSVYPYYKSIPISMDQNSQVIVRNVAMASGENPVETEEVNPKP